MVSCWFPLWFSFGLFLLAPLWLPHGFLLVSLWLPYDFVMVSFLFRYAFSCGFPVVALCCPYGFLMIFLMVSLWLPYAFLMVPDGSLWFPYSFPMVTLWLPYVLLMVSLCFPYGFHTFSVWFPWGCPMRFLMVSLCHRTIYTSCWKGPQQAANVEWKCRVGCRVGPLDLNVECEWLRRHTSSTLSQFYNWKSSISVISARPPRPCADIIDCLTLMNEPDTYEWTTARSPMCATGNRCAPSGAGRI